MQHARARERCSMRYECLCDGAVAERAAGAEEAEDPEGAGEIDLPAVAGAGAPPNATSDAARI